ncbi:MAG: hypothetical protein E6767_07010 [Dysgonomonas sp.]|nr:hypothetical protein [Dysgonomonas sp.]
MKKQLFITLITFSSLFVMAQEGQKINAGVDLSWGPHYFNSKRNNPVASGISIGYEFDYLFFFGLEVGLKGGIFNQKVEYEDINSIVRNDIYKGSYWSPFIAPKIYLPVSYNNKIDRPRYLFLENKFSYTWMNMSSDRVEDLSKNAHRSRFQYELKLGYQFPINNRWAMACWIGYNSFDFSKVKPEQIKFKNSTPLEFGIGFNYIIKQD